MRTSSVEGPAELKDIFSKCHDFLDGPRFLSDTDCVMAAELFSDISPSANAGPKMRRNGRSLLQFSSNDYLGLAMHDEIRRVAVEAVQGSGICSPMGSRLMTGTTKCHVELESQIARFKGCEAALAFAAGSMAMIGTLACLAGSGDLLILDQFAHATLVCGAKASGARLVYFRHNDMEHLEQLLKRFAGSRPVAVVVDGVYSMQGDLAPLTKLVRLRDEYGIQLIVDDAHGTGVFGKQGHGTASHLGVADRVDLHLGTFSKAVGTIGGFLAGDQAVIDYVRFHAPTFVFTKAMPLAVAAATSKALELVERSDERRKRLWENTRRLQSRLLADGFRFGRSQSPITPIEFSGTGAIYFAHGLRKQYGIWASPVVYPAVPLGQSILRVIPTAQHADEDIERLLHGLRMIRAALVQGAMMPA